MLHCLNKRITLARRVFRGNIHKTIGERLLVATKPSIKRSAMGVDSRDLPSDSRDERASLGDVEDGRSSEDVTLLTEEAPPRRDGLLFALRILAALNICAALLVCAAHIDILSRAEQLDLDADKAIVRVYGILFALLAILTELDWARLRRQLQLLQSWLFRGLFYIFVGLLSFESGNAAMSGSSSERLLDEVAGAAMAALGALYCVMELLCCRVWRNRRIAEKARLVEMRREADELAVRRAELEAELRATEEALGRRRRA
eukprot:PLAT13235.1.p1 GENE.PLAT13235.1~~PLAT13235.1.p1  ORF type:complete len:260 (+),score=69.09 PLAT13235.1:528-1307(+)